jgi:hypothetical protein
MPHWSVYQALHVSADRQIPQALVALGGSRSIRVGLVYAVGSAALLDNLPTRELAARQESRHRNQRYEKNDRIGLGHGGGRRKFYEADRGCIR